MVIRSDPALADEHLAAFIDGLANSPRRSRRLWLEGQTPIPIADALARDFQDRTEQLSRYIAAENQRRQIAAGRQTS
ncbi:hypothetical protein MicroSTF_14165 [Microbacterium sp. STF-2]|uniref:hypothetical protein n=1 Tax=Microbacterium sp. STF-2 TaxID=3031132 RepID=UPI002B000DE4|nr:hypothetical protein [Microbacterium sp. STF-2]MEA1264184.1 hypothetical protein [Microbacterium sp. STF-2]